MRELIPGVNVTDINDIDSKSRREFVKKINHRSTQIDNNC